jgi:hypothetical protein
VRPVVGGRYKALVLAAAVAVCFPAALQTGSVTAQTRAQVTSSGTSNEREALMDLDPSLSRDREPAQAPRTLWIHGDGGVLRQGRA